MEEGQQCTECNSGTMEIKSDSCSCHISPPCSSCLEAPLVCDGCGHRHEMKFEVIIPKMEKPFDYSQYTRKRNVDLGNGKRLVDFDYDSSSGSTMVYSGRIEGAVTDKDILDHFGSGTFGHRGPSIYGDRFTFTKITD